MTPGEKEAFAELSKIYARLEEQGAGRTCLMCGRCCHFETFGHRLYATYLEAAYLLWLCGPPPGVFGGDRCGWQRGRLCTARAGRVLGCRTFFCGEAGGFTAELHERALAEIKRIAGRHGLPVDYLPLEEHAVRFQSARVPRGARAK